MSGSESGIRIIAFDVDGTLVENDEGLVVWQVLNLLFSGSSELNAQRFDWYRKGKITYAQWVGLDIEGWRQGGATRERMVDIIRSHLRLVADAQEVIQTLFQRGYRLAVVSGTLDIVLDTLFSGHPFEWVFTNRIHFDGQGKIEGWSATPFDMKGKAEALRNLSKATGMAGEKIAFVGDHLNDLEAMGYCGCPIAYDPKKDAVRRAAKHVIARGQLARLLTLFPGPMGDSQTDLP